ncbi:MAG: hypothetical protein WCJ17_03120 [bacterium]
MNAHFLKFLCAFLCLYSGNCLPAVAVAPNSVDVSDVFIQLAAAPQYASLFDEACAIQDAQTNGAASKQIQKMVKALVSRLHFIQKHESDPLLDQLLAWAQGCRAQPVAATQLSAAQALSSSDFVLMTSDDICYELSKKPEYAELFDLFVSLQVCIQEKQKKEIADAARAVVRRIRFIAKYAPDPLFDHVILWLQAHKYIPDPAVVKRKRLKALKIAGIAAGVLAACFVGLKVWKKAVVIAGRREVLQEEKTDVVNVATRYNTERARLLAAKYRCAGQLDKEKLFSALDEIKQQLRLRRQLLYEGIKKKFNNRRNRGQLLGWHARGLSIFYVDDDVDRGHLVIDLTNLTHAYDMFGDARARAEKKKAKRNGTRMQPIEGREQLSEIDQSVKKTKKAKGTEELIWAVFLASKLDSKLPLDAVSLIHEYLVGPLPSVPRPTPALTTSPHQDMSTAGAGLGAGSGDSDHTSRLVEVNREYIPDID